MNNFMHKYIYIYMHNSVQVQATLRRAARECIPGETQDEKKAQKIQKTGRGKGRGKGKGRGGRGRRGRGRGGRGRGRKQNPAETVEEDPEENLEMKLLAKEDQKIIRELKDEDLEMEVVGLNSATNFKVPLTVCDFSRCMHLNHLGLAYPHQHSAGEQR